MYVACSRNHCQNYWRLVAKELVLLCNSLSYFILGVPFCHWSLRTCKNWVKLSGKDLKMEIRWHNGQHPGWVTWFVKWHRPERRGKILIVLFRLIKIVDNGQLINGHDVDVAQVQFHEKWRNHRRWKLIYCFFRTEFITGHGRRGLVPGRQCGFGADDDHSRNGGGRHRPRSRHQRQRKGNGSGWRHCRSGHQRRRVPLVRRQPAVPLLRHGTFQSLCPLLWSRSPPPITLTAHVNMFPELLNE